MKKASFYILVSLVVLAWGNAFVAIKYLLVDVHFSAMQLTAVRYLPAAVLSLLIVLVAYAPKMIFAVWRSEWKGIALYGITGVLGYNIALNFGETRIAAGAASLIVGLSPIMTLLASRIFLKEKITVRKVAGIAAAFAGLFIVVRWGTHETIDFSYLVGVLVTLGAPVSWAVYTIVGKPMVTREDPNLVTLSAIIWGSLPLLFFLPPAAMYSAIPLNGWMALAFLTFICTVFGFLVWSWALRHTEAARLGAVVYLIPLVTIVSGMFILGEKMTLGLAIGGIILIGGVVLAET